MLPRTRGLRALAVLVALTDAAFAQPARALKVFISIDMEGLAGVVASTEVNPAGPDYGHFRAIMAAEANAAVDGAFRAGASDVVVRDSR